MKAKINGVEIEAGQIWKCKDDEYVGTVEILAVRKSPYKNLPDAVSGYIKRDHKLVTMEEDDFVELI